MLGTASFEDVLETENRYSKIKQKAPVDSFKDKILSFTESILSSDGIIPAIYQLSGRELWLALSFKSIP